MNEKSRRALELAACDVRRGIIESTHAAKSGHPGGSLSAADMFTYLYMRELRVDPAEPEAPWRDRFVLSKGHTAPGLYAALALRGFFPREALLTLRHSDSFLQGHPSMGITPGVDMSTGSLGQGVSAAVGMALGGKLRGERWRVYTLLGDGEIQEGEVWEALMSAAHFSLSNLCVIIDNNRLQIDGEVAKVMSPYPIAEKLRAFGFETAEIDGHSFDDIERAFELARESKDHPFVIVMHTVKGKGVSFMENSAEWHGKATNDEQTAAALAEIAVRRAELEEEAK